jgi:hypothetical protein
MLVCQKCPSSQCSRRGSHNTVDPTSSLRYRVTFAVYMLTAVISLAGRGDPDSMNAARNNPSASPPFVTIWSDTEIEPALSPQLNDVSRLRDNRSLRLHGHFGRIATKDMDVLLYPVKCQTLCKSDVTAFISRIADHWHSRSHSPRLPTPASLTS